VVTVIGGGLAGLAAAITAAELGASVTLHEAHRTVGGRWRSTPVRKRPRTDAVYRAHEGPHVIYRDGPIWPWLRERGLLGVTCGVPLGAVAAFGSGMRGGCEPYRLPASSGVAGVSP
jgi:NADPH-dependent 2,4-dienoyl-CoA reductase/sulfur reductase-like enzyme